MHKILLYFATMLFIVGGAMFSIFSIVSDKMTVTMFVVSCYFMVCGVMIASFVTCLPRGSVFVVQNWEDEERLPLKVPENEVYVDP